MTNPNPTYKWNSEQARKAGQSRSEKKLKAIRLNSIKHGRYVKDPETLKIITPKPLEKAAGITKQDKIDIYKKICRAGGADTAEEYWEGMKEEYASLKAVIQREINRGNLSSDKEFKWRERLVRILHEKGRLRHELGVAKFNQNVFVKGDVCTFDNFFTNLKKEKQ